MQVAVEQQVYRYDVYGPSPDAEKGDRCITRTVTSPRSVWPWTRTAWSRCSLATAGTSLVVIIVCSTGQFHMGPFSHANVDITQNRVCLESEMGGCAFGVAQIDSHVAEYGDGDQFILDIPGSSLGTFV
jgi:hypothetical protein